MDRYENKNNAQMKIIIPLEYRVYPKIKNRRMKYIE
jgi:hypothetical protein